MESRVSSRATNFDEFKKSQDEFRISQAKFRAEIKTTQDLILLQLKLLAEKLGVESSAAIPTHHPFIKMTSPISLVKSNQVVLKLQSFHEEKILAREKVDEFWSQFRPKYKPKSPPCLRPILKKFKKVRDYGKHHDDDSATFRSNPKFQGSFGVFRNALARENETLFDLFNKKTEDSVMGSSVLDSDCMKSKIQACILGSTFLVSNVQKSNFTDHGYGRVGSVKERFKSPNFSISHGIVIDFLIRVDLGFILNAKQMLIPAAGVGVHLGHNVFDEMPHSTYNCVLQLGYHMPISDSGGTLITGHFISKFQVKDAYNSKFLVCNGEFLKNGTTDLRDEIVLVVSNFCDKESDKTKIMAVGFVGFYPFLNAQPSILVTECHQEWVGMYAHHVVVGMQQTVSIASLKLGFHEFTRDKGGTTIQMLFHLNSAIVLESDCANGKSRVFILEIHISNVEFKKAKLPGSCALYLFAKMSNLGYIFDIKLGYHMSNCDKCGTNSLFSFESIDLLASCKDSSFCVVIDRSMGYYCKGTRDKGGTINQRLFSSKSKNTDCVLGFDCSKVIKCEVSFDSSMIIDGEDAGNLGLHHLEACMDKNRNKARQFAISTFETGWCVVLDHEYCKGIRDKGGGSNFRKQTSEMICMRCLHIQPVGPICSTPSYNGLSMAKYYCNSCKLFDVGRSVYHCPFCNLCPVGKGLSIDYFHYMKCNCCLSISIVNYKCREKCLKVNCPICNGFLFTSTSSIRVFPCSHLMHVVCLEAFPRSHYSTCSVCCKSSGNMMRASTQSSILVSGLGPTFYVSINGQIYEHWLFLRASYDMNIIVVVMAEMEKFMKVTVSLVLPLSECDVTIGGQWLYTFEPVCYHVNRMAAVLSNQINRRAAVLSNQILLILSSFEGYSIRYDPERQCCSYRGLSNGNKPTSKDDATWETLP